MSIKLGKPKKGETREELTKITFKGDTSTVDDLEFIEDHLDLGGMTKRGKRSVVIRRAISELRKRVEGDAR